MTPADLIARLPRDRLLPLPQPRRADGALRRTGVEIEFAGLTQRAAAEVARGLFGGQIAAQGDHAVTLEGSAIGDVAVELDSALAKKDGAVAETLLDMTRAVIPVEIVTAPLAPDDLARIDRLIDALRDAGAQGSRDGALFGFGLHLNPEVAAGTAAAIVPTARAYALIEDWLRAADPVDPSRRLTPFVDPWPRAFVDLIAAQGAGWSLGDLTGAYLALTPTRNRGLDLLPLLERLDPERVRAALPAGAAKGGRPTWHYRLPEARLGDPGWSAAYEWNRWVLVERVAAEPALLAALGEGWAAHRASLTTLRPDWAGDAGALLAEAPIWGG